MLRSVRICLSVCLLLVAAVRPSSVGVIYFRFRG